MKNFTVYSKDGCPHCVKVLKVLHLSELSFVEYKLNRDFTKEEFVSEFGTDSTFPQVIVGDKKLGGCSETVKYLSENKMV